MQPSEGYDPDKEVDMQFVASTSKGQNFCSACNRGMPAQRFMVDSCLYSFAQQAEQIEAAGFQVGFLVPLGFTRSAGPFGSSWSCPACYFG